MGGEEEMKGGQRERGRGSGGSRALREFGIGF